MALIPLEQLFRRHGSRYVEEQRQVAAAVFEESKGFRQDRKVIWDNRCS